MIKVIARLQFLGSATPILAPDHEFAFLTCDRYFPYLDPRPHLSPPPNP